MNSITVLLEKIENAKDLDFGDIFNKCIELFKKVWLQGLVMLLLTFVLSIPFARASQNTARHQLQIELFPDGQQLQVLDQITFEKSPGAKQEFELSPRAEQIEINVNGKPRKFIFENLRLQVDFPCRYRWPNQIPEIG